jgi:hypothetical protein
MGSPEDCKGPYALHVPLSQGTNSAFSRHPLTPAFSCHSCPLNPPLHACDPTTWLFSPFLVLCLPHPLMTSQISNNGLFSGVDPRCPFLCLLLVLFSEKANGNWWIFLQFPPVSYKTLGYTQMNYSACYFLHADFLFDFCFSPEYRATYPSETIVDFHQLLSPDYTALYTSRENSS